jgi:hypothetical protein
VSLSKIRARMLAILLGAFAVAVTVLPTGPAQAAGLMTCSHAPAPSVTASAGVVSAHYFFSCNTIAGVTDITALSTFRRQDGFIPHDATADTVRHFLQNSAAWQGGFNVGSRHGTWVAVEILHIHGTFTFQADGCGRVSPTEVDCHWESAPVFG